ncbi:MAG: NADPH-dependent oxidoreductase [Puniceicoccaceae bacterium]|nr:MAG: NADPH-dependent oxidoreductase [Puniceicoccaceae bacterium]
MHVFILSGSHREKAESLKVARFLQAKLEREHAGVSTFLYSLSNNPLPLWTEDEGGAPGDLWDPIAAELKRADALIVVCPEWNGMATSGTKNFLHLAGVGLVGHKPALAVAVSAGVGGAYVIAELRMSGYKNNRLCWLPEHLIIRGVGKVFNRPEPDESGKEDRYLHGRAGYALRLLVEYGKALRAVRATGVIDHEKYGNGM